MKVIIEQSEIRQAMAELVQNKTGCDCSPEYGYFDVTGEDGKDINYESVTFCIQLEDD